MAQDDLGVADVQELARALTEAKLADAIVLIGGQAINLWAERYMSQAPELKAGAPYTSKDIDFCGTSAQARALAKALKGKAVIPTLDDATPNSAIVLYEDEQSKKRQIDFLKAPAGLVSQEVLEMSIPVDHFRVLHPVHCLESRTCNTATLPGYDTPHALGQLRTAIVVARTFLLELLKDKGKRVVGKLCERIFDLAKGRNGLKVFREHGIDVFEAALSDPRMSQTYRTVRYPQMQRELAKRRGTRRKA